MHLVGLIYEIMQFDVEQYVDSSVTSTGSLHYNIRYTKPPLIPVAGICTADASQLRYSFYLLNLHDPQSHGRHSKYQFNTNGQIKDLKKVEKIQFILHM